MKLHIKTKKTMIAALLCGVSYSPASNAIVLPSIDVAVLTQTIANNIQELRNWVEQKTMMQMGMDMDSVYAAMGIDNDNARTVQEIQAAQTAEQKKSELQALKESAPANNACTTLANQAMGAAVSCDAANVVKKTSASSIAKRAGGSATPTEVKAVEKAINKEIIDTCSELISDENRNAFQEAWSKSGSEKTLTDADKLALSKCVQPLSLAGSDKENNALTPEDKIAAEHFKELIIGPTPVVKNSSLLDKDSDSYKKVSVEEARVEAFRNLAELSFSEAIAMRSAGENGTNPSELFILQDFNDKHYGDKEWMAQLQNVDKPTKNLMQPPEVLRHIAVMDAFMIHFEMIKYKQQLRMEALQAATLALMIEPPKR
ncbi:hypothetical protein D3C87_351690 [compost metagenome]